MRKHAAEAAALKVPTIRAGTKQATLIAMLRAQDGATIKEIMAATGWQSHYADVGIRLIRCAVPDESTIRKRLSPLWRKLRGEEPVG